jgi:hypothetical protein
MRIRGWVSSVTGLIALLALAEPAAAYIGPGSGLMAVGVFLAVVAAVLVAIAGFLWYPLKRLWRRARGRGDGDEQATSGG